jgi:hypothetical protein
MAKLSFKKHLFAKIIRDNEEAEKYKRNQDNLSYWEKYR